VILDPFLGSGSLIEAALRNGRLAIGFEIKPEYVAMAADRVDSYLRLEAADAAQRRLF
jgi:adenine-specific DNA-methyltransferase